MKCHPASHALSSCLWRAAGSAFGGALFAGAAFTGAALESAISDRTKAHRLSAW